MAQINFFLKMPTLTWRITAKSVTLLIEPFLRLFSKSELAFSTLEIYLESLTATFDFIGSHVFRGTGLATAVHTDEGCFPRNFCKKIAENWPSLNGNTQVCEPPLKL